MGLKICGLNLVHGLNGQAQNEHILPPGAVIIGPQFVNAMNQAYSMPILDHGQNVTHGCDLTHVCEILPSGP